jgi:hypothetical protein
MVRNIGLSLPKPIGQRARVLGLEPGPVFVIALDIGVDGLPVGEVVREGRVDFGEGEAGVGGDDLVGTQAASLVFEDNVLDRDPMTGDARFAAQGARRALDARLAR